MVRDRQSEETRNQNSSSASGAPASESTAQLAERERGIHTTRERDRSSAVTRPSTAPVQVQTPSPFSLMRRMADDMDRLFDTFGLGGLSLRGFDDLWGSTPTLQQSFWSPQVEMLERDNKLVIRADLPGLNKESVNVEVDNDVLAISGERKDEREENREGFYRSERSYGQFYRAIPLPPGVDPEQCEATFKDGVLEVSLTKPTQVESRGKKIPVR